MNCHAASHFTEKTEEFVEELKFLVFRTVEYFSSDSGITVCAYLARNLTEK